MDQENDDMISPPGDTIIDIINELDMSKEEFAQEMNASETFVDFLLDGKEVITLEVANKLERITGVNSDFWINRESNYRKKLSENKGS